MEVDLGPGDIVLDGDPDLLSERGTAAPPLFGPCLVAKRLPISPISAAVEFL